MRTDSFSCRNEKYEQCENLSHFRTQLHFPKQASLAFWIALGGDSATALCSAARAAHQIGPSVPKLFAWLEHDLCKVIECACV